MEIIYTTDDISLEYKLTYVSKTILKRYYNGKSYVKLTQVVLYANGLVIHFANVIKHKDDNDDINFAYREATAKVINKIPFKDIRGKIWKLLFEKIQYKPI